MHGSHPGSPRRVCAISPAPDARPASPAPPSLFQCPIGGGAGVEPIRRSGSHDGLPSSIFGSSDGGNAGTAWSSSGAKGTRDDHACRCGHRRPEGAGDMCSSSVAPTPTSYSTATSDVPLDFLLRRRFRVRQQHRWPLGRRSTIGSPRRNAALTPYVHPRVSLDIIADATAKVAGGDQLRQGNSSSRACSRSVARPSLAVPMGTATIATGSGSRWCGPRRA
jgi:hypothetical protein